MQTTNWIALSSLAVAFLALWRSGRARVLDLRTSVLKDQAQARLEIDELTEKIRRCLKSREVVCAMTGQSGALEHFRGEVAADTAELDRLHSRLAGIGWVSGLANYQKAEEIAVAVHELRGRVQQLREKYAAAWAEDEVQRQRRHD